MHNYKSIFLHRLTLFLRPIFLTATATECVDKKSAKKCNKAKRKGKCNKSWAQRDCQLTCGVCTSSAKDAVAGANSKHLLKIEFWQRIYFFNDKHLALITNDLIYILLDTCPEV